MCGRKKNAVTWAVWAGKQTVCIFCLLLFFFSFSASFCRYSIVGQYGSIWFALRPPVGRALPSPHNIHTHTHTHIQNLLFALCLVLPRGYRGIQPLYQSCGIHEALELRCLFFCNHFDQLCTFFLVFIPKTVPGFSKLSGYLTNQTES